MSFAAAVVVVIVIAVVVVDAAVVVVTAAAVVVVAAAVVVVNAAAVVVVVVVLWPFDHSLFSVALWRPWRSQHGLVRAASWHCRCTHDALGHLRRGGHGVRLGAGGAAAIIRGRVVNFITTFTI